MSATSKKIVYALLSLLAFGLTLGCQGNEVKGALNSGGAGGGEPPKNIDKSFSPSSSEEQTLEADSEVLAGTLVVFPPGAVSQPMNAFILEGGDLLESVTEDLPQIAGNNEALGVSIIIVSDSSSNLAAPMQITMPLSEDLSLVEVSLESIHVIYRTKNLDDDQMVSGVIPHSDLEISDSAVKFYAAFFGQFQLVSLEEIVEEKLEVNSDETFVSQIGSGSGETVETTQSSSSEVPLGDGGSTTNATGDPNPPPPILSFMDRHLVQVNNAASAILTVTDGDAPFTFSIESGDAGATIIAATDTFSFTPTVDGIYDFTIKVTDSLGETDTLGLTVLAAAAGICVWNGETSSVWENSANWSFCGGALPEGATSVVIPEGVTAPILSSNQNIYNFGRSSIGGGTITINAGSRLKVGDEAESVGSDVKFVGDTPTCTTCILEGNGAQDNAFFVVNHATLELGSGIVFEVAWGDTTGALYLGKVSPNETGHLVIDTGSANESEWPVIRNGIGGSIWNGIQVIGGAVNDESSVYIDGVVMTGLDEHSYFFLFDNYFRIKRMDRVVMDHYRAHDVSEGFFKLVSCMDGVLEDEIWTSLHFVDIPTDQSEEYNVYSATDCGATGFGPVVFDVPQGYGWGAQFENGNDMGQVFDWPDETPFTCTWTGAVSTDWQDGGNWTNCNSRSGAPDQFDSVLIPSTANQPVIADAVAVLEFAAGTGGGEITIHGTGALGIVNGLVKSDIAFSGGTSTCNNCRILSQGLQILEDATLTLLPGSELKNNDFYGDFYVGNGTSPGHLVVAGTPGDPNEWPELNLGTNNTLYVHGSALLGDSTLNIVGLEFNDGHEISPMIEFVADWTVVTFDNVSLTSDDKTSGNSMIHFQSCPQTNYFWNNVEFIQEFNVAQLGFNVSSQAPSCPKMVTFNGATGNFSGGTFTESLAQSYVSWGI